jgi:hypothetical protein
MKTNRCSKCHKVIPAPEPGSMTTGYGRDKRGRKVCFECCAIGDREYMHKHGQINLYLVNHYAPNEHESGWSIINWPGTLKIPCNKPRKGRHNIAGTRYDVWFHVGSEWWHGVQCGENTQVVHCKRIKNR